jgi:hypothetical protein
MRAKYESVQQVEFDNVVPQSGGSTNAQEPSLEKATQKLARKLGKVNWFECVSNRFVALSVRSPRTI